MARLFTLSFEGQPCHIVIETEEVLTPEASAANAVFLRS
jgi:hypothetical protein